MSLEVGQKSQVVIPNVYERLTASQPQYRDNNTSDLESNQYVEVVQFFQEIRIDSKNMHLLKDINYWILVKDFDYSRRFHIEGNKNMREFRVGRGSQPYTFYQNGRS